MKKLILPILVAGICVAPSLASASMNPYVSISGGAGIMQDSSENGFSNAVQYGTGYLINGAFGLKNDAFRVEAEIGYHSNSIDSYYGLPYTPDTNNLNLWSFMANAYYDFNMTDSDISPFIMGGLGLANVSWDYPGGSEDDSVFAWQLGAGVAFRATKKLNIDVGYRYFSTADVDMFGGYKYSIGSHNIIAGVRFDL